MTDSPKPPQTDQADEPVAAPPASAPEVEPTTSERGSASPPARDAPDAREERLLVVAALIGLMVTTLVVRYSTLQTIEVGGDAVKAWFNAKLLNLGLAGRFWEWDHHAIRFAIILPTFLIQKVFGMGPRAYYVFPLVMSLLQVTLVLVIGHRMKQLGVGFCAALATLWFSPFERTGGQILSEVPSTVAILAGVYVLLRYRDEPARRKGLAVALALVIFFLGWMTKLNNVLVVPAFALAMWIYARRWRDVALFCGLLFGLFLVETLLYRTLLDFPLGQLSIVRKTHLSHKALQPVAFSKLFTQFAKLPPAYAVVLWAFAASLVVAWAARRKVGWGPLIVALVPATFLVLQNFAVKSVSPLVPVQRFLPRYLQPIVPVMLLVVFWVAASALSEAARRWAPRRRWPSRRALAAIGAAALLATCGWFAGARRAGSGGHAFDILARQDREANEAFAQGVPVVSLSSPKPPDFFVKVLWNGFRSREGFIGMPATRQARQPDKSTSYFVLHPARVDAYAGMSDLEIFDTWKGREVIVGGQRLIPHDMGMIYEQRRGRLAGEERKSRKKKGATRR